MIAFKKLLYLSLITTSFFGFSQDVLWQKTLGGKHAEFLYDAQPTADYGFILAGSSLSVKSGNKEMDNLGDLDYWVWKMNEKGDLEWQKSFGGSGTDQLTSLKLTHDGGFLLGGSSTSSKNLKDEASTKKEDCFGLEDFWIVKLNAVGAQEWQKTQLSEVYRSLCECLQTSQPQTQTPSQWRSRSYFNRKPIRRIGAIGQKNYWRRLTRNRLQIQHQRLVDCHQ